MSLSKELPLEAKSGLELGLEVCLYYFQLSIERKRYKILATTPTSILSHIKPLDYIY